MSSDRALEDPDSIIVAALRRMPGMTRYEVATATRLARATVDRHMADLARRGVVREVLLGRRRVYAVGVRPSLVPAMRLLRREPLAQRVLAALAVPTSVRELANALTVSEKVVRRCILMLVQSGVVQRGDRRGDYQLAPDWQTAVAPASRQQRGP